MGSAGADQSHRSNASAAVFDYICKKIPSSGPLRFHCPSSLLRVKAEVIPARLPKDVTVHRDKNCQLKSFRAMFGSASPHLMIPTGYFSPGERSRIPSTSSSIPSKHIVYVCFSPTRKAILLNAEQTVCNQFLSFLCDVKMLREQPQERRF